MKRAPPDGAFFFSRAGGSYGKEFVMAEKQKITTFLWFNNNAEEAVNHYISIFHNSKILNVHRTGDAGPGPKGSILTIDFQLEGQRFIALNGGPQFKFNEAISLFVSCESQAEVDELWRRLVSGGGEESMCGWLKDKFGLSWQIIPTALLRLLHDENPERAKRAMEAMLQMKKIDIRKLEEAVAKAPV
jgi:predicted 3-demethylubiquinone-9 3-methyltransferase (glyoxalase superfamily)